MTFQTNFKSDAPSRVDRALAKQQAEEAQWRKCCKAVDARDHRKCRACGRKSDPDVMGLTKRGHRHHMTYRSHQGPDVSENVITICSVCHDAVHVKRTMRIEGDNANEAVGFWKKDKHGDWFLWRREMAVGRFERD